MCCRERDGLIAAACVQRETGMVALRFAAEWSREISSRSGDQQVLSTRSLGGVQFKCVVQ
jgi:hypothetical protein